MKPIRSRGIAVLICLPFCSAPLRDARAFSIDGFWSGMPVQQFAFVASAQGLTARPGEPGYFYLGAGVPPQPISKVGFCGGLLASYTRNIQSDADYARLLANIFSLYGPPRKMQFGGEVEPGVAAGAFRATGATLWAKGADRVWMNSAFDWRLYQGQLYRQQPASVRFEILNPCNI